MDWTGNPRVPLVPHATAENSLSLLYNSDSYDHRHFAAGLETHAAAGTSMYGGKDPKKKKLTSEQVVLLENKFQMDINLDPERKMRLAKELGVQPRQIAVWFQNRRARWKGKQLERLYNALKQEYDNVSREKQKLQQEVMALRTALLKDQLAIRHVSVGYSAREMIGSTSITDHQNAECIYDLNVEDFSSAVMMKPNNWAAMPSRP